MVIEKNLFFFCKFQDLQVAAVDSYCLPVDYWCEIAGPNFTAKEIIKKKFLILTSNLFPTNLVFCGFRVASVVARVLFIFKKGQSSELAIDTMNL